MKRRRREEDRDVEEIRKCLKGREGRREGDCNKEKGVIGTE